MKSYKKYNIDATNENVLESIKNNTYDRNKPIKDFIEGLDMIETNVFISLDARWGEGKTFFVRQIEMTLDYLTKKEFGKDTQSLDEYFSKSELKNLSIKNTYLPIYYNAWLYDCHNDPLLSLLFILVKECKKYIDTKMDSNSFFDKISSILSPFSLITPKLQVAGNIEIIKESFKTKDILEEIKTAEEIREKIKEILDEIITEEAQKLVVFVDELDRCRPSYAIEMLERIKHFFDDDRIIFVVSVNKEQLVHTISKFYGNSFDSTGYLNKFFDINIYLQEIPKYIRNNNIFKINPEQQLIRDIVNDLGEYYRLSLRDSIIYQQNMDKTLKQYYNDNTYQGRMYSVFVAIMQILDIVNQDEKSKFMRGESEILKELLENVAGLKNIACMVCGRNSDLEIAYENGVQEINCVYKYAFGNERRFEMTRISADFKNMCIRICNG